MVKVSGLGMGILSAVHGAPCPFCGQEAGLDKPQLRADYYCPACYQAIDAGTFDRIQRGITLPFFEEEMQDFWEDPVQERLEEDDISVDQATIREFFEDLWENTFAAEALVANLEMFIARFNTHIDRFLNLKIDPYFIGLEDSQGEKIKAIPLHDINPDLDGIIMRIHDIKTREDAERIFDTIKSVVGRFGFSTDWHKVRGLGGYFILYIRGREIRTIEQFEDIFKDLLGKFSKDVDSCPRNVFLCRAFLLSQLSLGLEDSGLILGGESNQWDNFVPHYRGRYKEMIEYSAKPNWNYIGNAMLMACLSKLIIFDKERHEKEKYTRRVAISMKKDAKRQQARIKEEMKRLEESLWACKEDIQELWRQRAHTGETIEHLKKTQPNNREVIEKLERLRKKRQDDINERIKSLKKHEKMEKYLKKVLVLGDFLAHTAYTPQSAERILAFLVQELASLPTWIQGDSLLMGAYPGSTGNTWFGKLL